ncbi:VIER F-box protein 2 [Tanacetum coccineum]|uniref:VIER F-box protein 2 n=1 Tax=Tanacetum coccineum TaxID=301880 RepID=A0ABQ4Y0V2_9ASTR
MLNLTFCIAIKARFGEEMNSHKKTQKPVLKQQYENFNATSSESLDSIFNRLQKLVSRLAILGVDTPPEDLNVKFLRSLPSEWDTHVVVWMNKPDFETMGLDDLYNNFKIVEQKVKRTVAANNDDKNLAFLTHFQSKAAPRSKDNRNWNQGSSSKAVRIEDASEKAMCAIDGAGFDWSDMAEDEIQANMALMAYTDSEYDDLLAKLDDTGFKAATYKREIAFVEKKYSHQGISNGRDYVKTELKNKTVTDTKEKGVLVIICFPSPHPKILEQTKHPLDYLIPGLENSNSLIGCQMMRKKLSLYPKSNSQLNEKGFVDSGCSRHMSGNIAHLSDFKEFDGGYVTSRWRNKWRKITGKISWASLMEKSDEGFLVGYSLSSKAFRVYNIRTRKVQENLHVGFLENKPMLEGNGPKWLFDLDSLTQSMNYVPVVAGTFSNVSADQDGTHDDCSFQDNGIDDQQVNTASPQVNTGSREVSTAAPEVNTATPEGLMGPIPTTEDTQVEDQEIELGGIFHHLMHLFVSNKKDETSYSELGFTWLPYLEGKPHQDLHTLTFRLVSYLKKNQREFLKLLGDPAWVEAMQEELLQFKQQMIEAIRIFLAYASYMGFTVYQMDVKSAFLYGQIEEEVYVCQPLGFEDPDHPDKVYKVVQQRKKGIFISQDKYVHEILRKFNYTDVKSSSTPTDLEKPLVKDADVIDVDDNFIDHMIGSLMILQHLDQILFCSLYMCKVSVSPKLPISFAVQRIFRYLKSNLSGLWYSKDSLLELGSLDPKPTAMIMADLLTKGFDAGRFQYLVSIRMTKVIKGEFEKLEDLKVEDVSLTCDTSLEVFNNEFIRMSGMDNHLFTYAVEVANIPCDSNKDDDSEQRVSHAADDDMGYDPSDIAFTEWLGSKNFNYKTMDHYTKKALWIYWIRGDDEVELTDEEFSDNEDEVVEVFKIDTNIFDFETPMCKTFKEFNYLLQIDLVASGRGAEEDDVDHEKIQLTPADGDDDDERLRTWTEMRKWREEHPAPGRALSHWYTVCQTGYLIRDEPSISLPPREEKRVHFASPTPSHEVGESSAADAARQDKPAIARDDPYSIAREDLYGFVDMVDVPPRCSTSRELDYGITDTWDDLVGAIDEIAPTTLEGVNQRVRSCALISELQSADHRRQRVISELLASDHKRQKMAPKRRTTRRYCSLATRDATRNGNDSHTSGMGARRPVQVKGTDVVTYSQRFQELALMCDRMFPEEIDQVEKYVGGLPDMIHGSVMATKQKLCRMH